MDSIPQLRSIVIPALVHKMNGEWFSCLGDGLRNKGYTFDDHVKNYLPLLKPALTKAGKVKVHQPKIKGQPESYWKAQCVFRNLPQTGTDAELQEQLRIKNALGREEKWNRMETLDEKAEANPKRFILEHFSQGPGTLVVLKTFFHFMLEEEAADHNLFHEFVDAPLNPDGSRQDIHRRMIIGKDRSAVQEKFREISREATRARQHAEELKAERTRKLHESLVCTGDLSGMNKVWDVTGSWTISCQYVKEQWGEGNSGCSLEIYMTESGGRKQMSAQFDFIAITGIFRFISPVPSDHCTEKPQSSKSVAPTRVGICRAGPEDNSAGNYNDKVEDEEDDTERILEDKYYGFRPSPTPEDSPTPEEFYLSDSDHPSPKYPRWDYRWRGEETGEGEIQVGSDDKLCSITFGGSGGTKLVGMFDSDYTERIDFTGVKTGTTSGGGDPDSAWHCRNERAYDRATVERWH
ncbi:hypothetical protein MMC17_007713 [Xylographa soralifera]|nr:hypothetical protein [Xylographa soralifera]